MGGEVAPLTTPTPTRACERTLPSDRPYPPACPSRLTSLRLGILPRPRHGTSSERVRVDGDCCFDHSVGLHHHVGLLERPTTCPLPHQEVVVAKSCGARAAVAPGTASRDEERSNGGDSATTSAHVHALPDRARRIRATFGHGHRGFCAPLTDYRSPCTPTLLRDGRPVQFGPSGMNSASRPAARNHSTIAICVGFSVP
jgi:hypothetical protein